MGPRDRAILWLFNTDAGYHLDRAVCSLLRVESRHPENALLQRLGNLACHLAGSFSDWAFNELSDDARPIAIALRVQRIEARHDA